MLKNTIINREATKRVAIALEGLNEQVVYVGGAIVSLYIDDPAAEDVRPTQDIDITLEIASIGELEKIRKALSDLGFTQSAEDNVMCRFRLKDLKVDVMSTKEVGWAPANPWFKPGFNFAVPVQIDGIEIKILPIAYFLATKFSAHTSRGGRDPRMSHDFEDIVYILNYTSEFKKKILNSNDDVRQYLIKSFQKILGDARMQEAIIGNLYHEDQKARFERIIDEMKEIVSSK